MSAYALLLALTGLERLAEMAVSGANARWSLEQGGREAGRRHYPAMVALHAAFLLGCAVEPWIRGRTELPAVASYAFAVAMACQALRWWCIRTLGRQWNTRVIVVPGLARVTGGPYRWLRHPNYLAVALEGIALPCVGGAWVTAALFTFANARLMRERLAIENHALESLAASAAPPATGLRQENSPCPT